MRPSRAFFSFAALFFLVALAPLSLSLALKEKAGGLLAGPYAFSCRIAEGVKELCLFHKNAEDNRELRRVLAELRLKQFQSREIYLENERLERLLKLGKRLPGDVRRSVFARVIARSPAFGNRTLLIDKGGRDGLRANMLVLAECSLVGKIVEVWTGSAKVLLINDPSCRIGALVHRTRDQGVLYGTLSGECRVKYLPVDAALEPGDVVETAGFGHFYPKGIPIGRLERIWKEPGQIYQVAALRPLSDLGRFEEVLCIE